MVHSMLALKQLVLPGKQLHGVIGQAEMMMTMTMATCPLSPASPLSPTCRVHHQPNGRPRLHIILYQQLPIVQRKQHPLPRRPPPCPHLPPLQAAGQPTIQTAAQPPRLGIANDLVLRGYGHGRRGVGPRLLKIEADAAAGAVIYGADLVAVRGYAQQARLAEAVAVAFARDAGLHEGAAAHGGDAVLHGGMGKGGEGCQGVGQGGEAA